MNVTLLPKTKFGKYSIVLTVIFFALVVSINIIATLQGLPNNSNGTFVESFFDHIFLAIMTIGAFTATIISLIIGIITIIKNRERSVLVFICILIDILAVYFAIAAIIGEITHTNY